MGASPAVLTESDSRARWLDVIADPVRLQIIRMLASVADASASELANRGPASYQTLRRHLEALEAASVIESTPGVSDGRSSGRPAVRFRLAPAVRKSVSAALG
jgi:predicted ArsR family transcriptional regulator